MDFYIFFTGIYNKSLNTFDSEYGRIKRPNQTFIWFNEGFSMGRFNKYSCIGNLTDTNDNHKDFRIAILGDSYTESRQVFRRNQFHSIIENQLSMKLNRKVSVFNFGRSAFDFADMYASHQTLVNQTNPNIIIYVVDDFSCQHRDPLIPVVISKNDTIRISAAFPKEKVNVYNKFLFLMQQSTIINMYNTAYKIIVSDALYPKLFGKFYVSSRDYPLAHQDTNKISKLAYLIIDNLPKNTIIVNRGDAPMDSSLIRRIEKRKLHFIDLKDTLDVLLANNIDPHAWKVTAKKKGHWNHAAHKAIGEYLTRKIFQIHTLQKE